MKHLPIERQPVTRPGCHEDRKETTMKKFNYYREDDAEASTLYTDIPELEGGFILRTDFPETLYDFESFESTPGVTDEQIAANEAELAGIRRIIADPGTPWEPLNEEDAEYIRDCLHERGVN